MHVSLIYLVYPVLVWSTCINLRILLSLCCVLCLVAQLYLTLRPPSVCGNSPGKNTGVSCHALVQEIFPTQVSNPGRPHCRWVQTVRSEPQGSSVLSLYSFISYTNHKLPQFPSFCKREAMSCTSK